MAEIKAVLKDTSPKDISRVEEFYLNAPKEKREFLVLHLKDHKTAIKWGLHFIVEYKGRIVASTMVNPPSERGAYAEAGNTLIVEPVEGFSLQRFFLEIRAAALAVMRPGVLLITGVNPENKKSYKNVSSTEEFTRQDHPPEEVYSLCGQCTRKVLLNPGRRCCCDFFLLDADNHRTLVRRYLGRIDGRSPLVLQNKEGDHLHILLQSKWATEDLHLRTLRAFAEGREWLPLK